MTRLKNLNHAGKTSYTKPAIVAAPTVAMLGAASARADAHSKKENGSGRLVVAGIASHGRANGKECVATPRLFQVEVAKVRQPGTSDRPWRWKRGRPSSADEDR
jgi:hypothetical protein